MALAHRNIDTQHARESAARNDDIVQRIEHVRASVSVVDGCTERHAWLRRPALGEEGIEGRLDLERLGAREESHLSEVDTEQRCCGTGDGRGGAEEGSVPSERDQDLGAGDRKSVV